MKGEYWYYLLWVVCSRVNPFFHLIKTLIYIIVSQALDLTPAEAKKIAEDMKDDDHSAMHCSGVRLNSCKYQCVKAEGNSAFFRKKEMGGIAIHRTKKGVVLHCFTQDR